MAHHLIVGGQRSGKSRHAERLAQAWRQEEEGRRITLVATAVAGDEEMARRIARHKADRPLGIETVEAPVRLAQALVAHAAPGRILLVDCLTLWLANWLMPLSGRAEEAAWRSECEALLAVLPSLPSPVIFVSNEVGWGVSPMGAEVRHYVDELGRLNQAVAQACSQLTLMVAGQAWSRPVAGAGAC